MIRGIIFMFFCVSAVGVAELHEPSQTIQLRGKDKHTVPVVTALAIQPTGDLLATAGDDHAVRLWDLQTGQLQSTLEGHQDWVTCLAFFDGGTKLLTGSRDRNVLVWRLGAPPNPTRLGKHQHPISSLVVHDASKQLAVLGFRASLKIYSTDQSIQQTRTFVCPCQDTRAVAFSPSGDQLAAGGRNGKLRIWNLNTGESFDVVAHQRRLTSLVFASEEVLISAGEDRRIHVWDPRSGEKRNTLVHDSGKILAMTRLGSDRFAAATAQNRIPLFRVSGSRPYAVLTGHTGSVAALVARGDQLISGSFDTTVRVWSIAAVQQQHEVSNFLGCHTHRPSSSYPD